MQIVVLRHPTFFGSTSMIRYAEMIEEGMRERGHQVTSWQLSPRFHRLPCAPAVKKWLGYIDQFIVFPMELRQRLPSLPLDTLFIVPDQALGMWVKEICQRPHVVHCHDFLALRSALGEFPQNPTGWTGRIYQKLICKGFNRARHFISISEASRSDLHRFLNDKPTHSDVVYNGLNDDFHPMSRDEVEATLPEASSSAAQGCILHVGANVWYKNLPGVLEIYQAYVERSTNPLPLWMIGSPPDCTVTKIAAAIPPPGKVRFFSGLSHAKLAAAYCHSKVLLFPSLYEGFGWPILEALASGTLVITTHQAPMSEVAGNAGIYIPQRPLQGSSAWANDCAGVLERCLQYDETERQMRIALGHQQASRFSRSAALDGYEESYKRVMNTCGSLN